MGKIDNNKQMKRESLLDSAFSLFIDNGFNKTSISDIVNNAGVAKGTFYLYFKDKYDIRNHLIAHKASQVFQAAYTIYESLLSHAAYTYRSPELMFYMILELVSGTSYNAILYQQPVPLEELKPELYAAICGIFKQFRIRKKRKNAENAGADPASLFS